MLLTPALLHTILSIWLLNKRAKKGYFINIITDSWVSDLNNLWVTGLPEQKCYFFIAYIGDSGIQKTFFGTKV